jgi:hypothetical protein
MKTTGEVLDNHLMSFGKGDINGILSDYAPMAILFTPDGPLVGVDAMRPLYDGLIAEFAKPGPSFELKHQSLKESMPISYGPQRRLKTGTNWRQIRLS